MPTGIPNTRGKEFYRQRIKELEAHIQQVERRDRAFEDLKKWLAHRKLDYSDVLKLYRQLKPKRAAKAVKSKRPLQPRHKGEQ